MIGGYTNGHCHGPYGQAISVAWPKSLKGCQACGRSREVTKKQNMNVNEQNLACKQGRIIVYIFPHSFLSPHLSKVKFCYRLSLLLISRPSIGSLLAKMWGFIASPPPLCFFLLIYHVLHPTHSSFKEFLFSTPWWVQHSHIGPREKSSLSNP